MFTHLYQSGINCEFLDQSQPSIHSHLSPIYRHTPKFEWIGNEVIVRAHSNFSEITPFVFTDGIIEPELD